MDDLFVQTLRGIYHADQKIVQALPEMIENSANPRLKSGLEQDLAQPQQQTHRLEKMLEMHGSQAKAVDCPAIDGIIKEAKEIMGDVKLEDKEILDAAMTAAAQAVEQYEIARYGLLIAWARQLGLTEVAESEVNVQAMAD